MSTYTSLSCFSSWGEGPEPAPPLVFQEKQSEVTGARATARGAAERGPCPGPRSRPEPSCGLWAAEELCRAWALQVQTRAWSPLCCVALGKSLPRSGLLSSSVTTGLCQSAPGPGQVDTLCPHSRWPLNVGVFRCRAEEEGPGLPSSSPPSVHSSSTLASDFASAQLNRTCPKQNPPPWPDAPRLLGEPHLVGLPDPRQLADVFPPHDVPTRTDGDLHMPSTQRGLRRPRRYPVPLGVWGGIRS